jgi:predicted outer membrane repeat protein
LRFTVQVFRNYVQVLRIHCSHAGVIRTGEIKIDSTIYSPNTNDDFIIQDQVKVTSNTSKDGGGGIYISGGKLSITGGEISLNKAEYGAGIYTNVYRTTFDNGKAEVTFSGGVITKNEAEFVGGGVYIATNSVFTQSGKGSINGNTAGDGEGENIFRQQ